VHGLLKGSQGILGIPEIERGIETVIGIGIGIGVVREKEIGLGSVRGILKEVGIEIGIGIAIEIGGVKVGIDSSGSGSGEVVLIETGRKLILRFRD